MGDSGEAGKPDVSTDEVTSPPPSLVKGASEIYGERVLEGIRDIRKGVIHRDERSILRVIRRLSVMRRTIYVPLLKRVYKDLFATMENTKIRSQENINVMFERVQDLTLWSSQRLVNEEEVQQLAEAIAKEECKDAIDYVRLWIALLTAFLFIDSYVNTARSGTVGEVEIAMRILSEGGKSVSADCKLLIDSTLEHPSDLLNAKTYFSIARIHNLCGKGKEIRPFFLEAYRTARLERKPMCQATLINQLVQSYIDASEHDLAMKFVLKTTFPESIRSTAQIVRCLFNLGRIQAVRLEYSDAHEKIMAAVKKLPPSESYARGFKLLANKHAILVELLMGDIPSVAIFQSKSLAGQLNAYEGIVHAVRQGDLHAFSRVLGKYRAEFERDGTLFLVERLRHSVLKTGLRKINLSYSRISIQDIAEKLGISSEIHAEGILQKAILDGVVTGTIDTNFGCLISKTTTERQKTAEPAETFNKRIQFCKSMCKDAIQAIQYPEEDTLQARALEGERRRREMQEQVTRAQEDGYDEDDLL